jgi:hypothetical protein
VRSDANFGSPPRGIPPRANRSWTLEDEREEALRNIKDAVNSIRDLDVPAEIQPAFVFDLIVGN